MFICCARFSVPTNAMQQSSSREATGLQVYHRARNILQLVLLPSTDKSCSLSPIYLFHIGYFNIIIPCIRKSSNLSLSLSLSLLRVPPPQTERTSPLLSLTPYLIEQTVGTVLKTTFTWLVLLMEMQCVLHDEATELSQIWLNIRLQSGKLFLNTAGSLSMRSQVWWLITIVLIELLVLIL